MNEMNEFYVLPLVTFLGEFRFAYETYRTHKRRSHMTIGMTTGRRTGRHTDRRYRSHMTTGVQTGVPTDRRYVHT